MRGSIVLGLLNGLTIALLAMGLVLVYKAGRFVNVAHAQLGVISALVLAKLALDYDLNWYLAFPAAVGLGAAIGGLSEFLIIRPLAGRSRVTLLIATIGLSQVLLGLTYFAWLGPDRVTFVNERYPLPFQANIDVDSLRLGSQHILIAVLVPLLAGSLALILQYTSLGRAIRAAASNPDAAGLAGIDVRRVSTITWLLAGALSAVSAILAAPSQGTLDMQAFGPSLLLRALGATALAGFVSLPFAFAAGVGFGVIEAVTLHISGSGGTAEAVIFAVILVGLFLRSSAVSAASGGVDDRLEVDDRPLIVPEIVAERVLVRHSRTLLIGAGLFLGLLAPFLPVFRPEAKQFLLSITLVYAMVALSIVILTGWAGQVSLGQFALMGAGAFMAARLSNNGWSLPASIMICGVIGAAAAIVIGLPALRLSGLSLAVTTLGFAVVGPAWLFRQSWFATEGTTSAPPASIAGLGELTTQRSIYFAALAVLVIALLAASALRRSAPGRLIIAVRDNERSTASFGISPTAVKLSVFALSGFVASAAGVVWLAAFRNVSVEVIGPQFSQLMLSLAVVGGITSLPGAVLGSIIVFGIPAFTSDFVKSLFPNTVQLQLFLGGGGLLLALIANPGGLAAVFRHRWEQLLARIAADEHERRNRKSPDLADQVLRVREVSVKFGGIAALDNVSIDVRGGEIVGLIGSNGAGKTTLLNAISGVVEPDIGSITVLGQELVGLGPEYRAHFGVARSFQDARLFPGLTVRETIQVALTRQSPVGFLSSLVAAPWVRFTERQTRARAEELIAAFGLDKWRDTNTAELSTGTRRICDLVAQVAAGPKCLLLDEPTAGVAQREAEAFGPLLRRIATELECSVLIIEHDMPLILGLVDRVYCLERGRIIAHGTPSEIRDDPKVIASYLGTDEVAIARSGNGSAGAGRSQSSRRRRALRAQPTSAAQQPVGVISRKDDT